MKVHAPISEYFEFIAKQKKKEQALQQASNTANQARTRESSRKEAA